MKYRLVVTTDGRPEVLAGTLESFDRRVRPRPAETVVVDDSGDEHYHRYLRVLLTERERPFRLLCHPGRLGFCQTVSDAWSVAGEPGPEWVYWTEDDFVFRRDVDLVDLAFVLDHEANIAQMSLMRQPVNSAEIEAGGVFELYRESYERRGAGNRTWLESRTNFSTTNGLMRRRFMLDCPWPSLAGGCEGAFSIGLLAQGYRFGVWGTGEPWIEHVGVRSGTGY